VEAFVTWYNTKHLHSAIRFVTPEHRHNGRERAILDRRHLVYESARAEHPERWARNTTNWDQVVEVNLNPRKKNNKNDTHKAAA
jgi:D-lyxose ketol-isomerase